MTGKQFLLHLDISVFIILLLGIFGVFIGENSPHPKAMIFAGCLYFAAKIAWRVVEAIYCLYLKGEKL